MPVNAAKPGGPGRDPLLVRFTEHEPILTPAERDRLLAKWRADDGKRMTSAAYGFWMKLAMEKRGRRPKPNYSKFETPVTVAACNVFARWRARQDVSP